MRLPASIAWLVALPVALAAQQWPKGGPAVPHQGAMPRGLASELPEPADNRFDAARWELGSKLFFERDLSVDRSIACASCHVPELHFADNRVRSPGARGARTLRNTPSLVNAGFNSSWMWDGRATSLEQQVLLPIENEHEMGATLEEVLARLAAREEYARAFAAAYPDGLTRENLARSLAQYVRRLVQGDNAVDRFRASDFGALDEQERLGLWIYESKGGCWRCHGGANFTDERFHATGVGAVDGKAEPGRAAISGDPADHGRFKTPSLRGVAHTAPYMHDGSLATLEDVVAFYRRGGNPVEQPDPHLKPLELDEREAAGLVAFLRALSRTEKAAAADGAAPSAR